MRRWPQFLLVGMLVLVVSCSSINTREEYAMAISEAASSYWRVPETRTEGLNCVVVITQDRTGTVQSVMVESCNGTQEERESIIQAVRDSSPLPLPDDPEIFESVVRFTFRPTT